MHLFKRHQVALRPVRTIAPSVTPVTLDELKQHCHVDHADEDATLQAFLDAAVQKLDGLSGRLGRCMINQTWTFAERWWPGSKLIQLPDVSNVVVTYQDENDSTQTLATGNYQSTEVVTGTFIEWSSSFQPPELFDGRSDVVSFAVTAGYGPDPGDVPAPLRIAIKMLAGTWYQNREAYTADGGSELPFAVTQLIAGYRRNTV